MKYNTDLTLLCVRVPVSQKTEKIAETEGEGGGKLLPYAGFGSNFQIFLKFFELAQILCLAKRLYSRLKI